MMRATRQWFANVASLRERALRVVEGLEVRHSYFPSRVLGGVPVFSLNLHASQLHCNKPLLSLASFFLVCS
jgi:hypothetical protein